MSMTDPVADMLTRIRNGQSAGKKKYKTAFIKIKSIYRKGAERRRLHYWL